MTKSIKKSYKYLIVITGIILLVPTILYLLLGIPSVQTLMIRRITGHLSEKVNTTISVGSMEYKFFNKLRIHDILIKDIHNDTLIFAASAELPIRELDLRNNSFAFGNVTIDSAVVALITDTTGIMNLMWYLDLLRAGNDSVPKKESIVKFSSIMLNNARFALINRKGKETRMPIDFSDLHLTGINGKLSDFIVADDTTSFSIDELSFSSTVGFTVRNMVSKARISKNYISFLSSSINCDSSILNIDKVNLMGDSITGYSNFIEDVRLEINLSKSLVSSSDLQFFVPFASKVDETIWFSGKVIGTVSEMRGRNIEIHYGNSSYLNCDFDLSGLPEIRSSFIYLGVNSFRTNHSDISNLKIRGRPQIKIPDIFEKLGVISFDGSFTGFPDDFVTYGNLRSREGTISTDISLRPEDGDQYYIRGLLKGSGIALGRLIDNDELLGNMSIQAMVDGSAKSFENFSGQLTGKIDSITINSYKYKNIELNGTFSEKTWDGTIKLNDENIKLNVLGLFNFREELPEFDFTMNLEKASLYNLKLDRSDTSAALSMLVTANFKGTNIDNLDGEIKLLNSTLRKYGNNLDIYDLSIRTFSENGKPAISLRTDYMNADLRGKYNFAGLKSSFSSVLSALAPSKFEAPEKNAGMENNFTYSVNFKNTDKLNEFFRTGLRLADKSSISGVMVDDSIMLLDMKSESLLFRGIRFSDVSLSANYLTPGLDFILKTSSLKIFNQSDLKGFTTEIKSTPDNFKADFNWNNEDSGSNRGKISAKGIFNRKPTGNTALLINIDSTSVFSRSKRWAITPSLITIDTNSININNLYISSRDNYYRINGTVSSSPKDTLGIGFEGIDISWLNGLTSRKNKTDQLYLGFKGRLSGKVLVSGLYGNPLVESNLNISGFSMLQSDYGDLKIASVWNNTEKVAEIVASNNLEGKKMLDISGYYDPSTRKINLNGSANNLPIDALNPLLRSFASGITGTASGKVNLSGETNKLILNGALMAENAVMKVNYLQTKYKLNDSVRFDKNGIHFRNIRVTDERGTPATLNGSVRNTYFKEFLSDLMITTNETMVLNTRQKDNDLFYGTAFASGVTTIKSSPGTLSFDVSARTGKGTRFFIPLNTSETITDYSFVKFVNRDTTVELGPAIAAPQKTSTGIELNFDLDITPEAEVQLIFDPKVGDIMKGRGTGNLNISLNKKGDFRISGDYIIEDGDYLFTLKNILNKSFSVEDGGKISFNGPIENADIDIKAIYRLKASLYEILKDEKFNETIPVECHILLSGKLFNPIVSFNIYLPTADEETRTYLKNVITTEEELSRQFLYLLVMNSFYSDPSYGTSISSTTASTGTSAMAVTTTEMLSNQLSNWLSQISNDFDIGFLYRPGQKELSDQEIQMAFSTQFLNDRIVINGNFDVRGLNGMSDNTSQLTGDFDLEYRLTDKIRLKVFNRSNFNNPYTGKQAPYTQGLGIFYRQDFDKFSDLFRRKEKSEMKKEEEPEPVNKNQ